MSSRLPALLCGIAVVLSVVLAPCTWAGPILGDRETGARFHDAAALDDFLSELGIDPRKGLIALAQASGEGTKKEGAWDITLSVAGELASVDSAGEYNWARSGGSPWVSFTLSRTGERLDFDIGGVLTSTIDPRVRDISTLALSARTGAKNEEVQMRHLSLDGSRLDGIELGAKGNNADIALLERIAGDFVLTGQVRMQWDGPSDAKDGSRPSFQFAGYGLLPADVVMPGTGSAASGPATIPEPTSALILLAGMLGVVGTQVRRRRSGPSLVAGG